MNYDEFLSFADINSLGKYLQPLTFPVLYKRVSCKIATKLDSNKIKGNTSDFIL